MKKIIFFITAMCLFAMHGCQKDIEAPVNDIIITDQVEASQKEATISGTVECPVSITKIELWIDSDENFSNHTVHDIELSDKAFSILVNELNFNTTYYYKYVVYNAVDMAELEKKNFITQDATLPSVTTAEVTSITIKTAMCGGNVTFDGWSEITARGVCWSTSPNPTINDSKTTDGSGIGSFTSNITGLADGTTYYVRAYATNSKGTAYGEEKSFTTLLSINGYDWVDLGLPSGLKWATCNVGATTPEGYGNFYAWGETTTKTSYDQSNSVTYGQQISDFSGNATYDAARANWGSTWRMPTKAEAEELRDNCTWTWTSQNGVNGMRVTGPNGNSIFLPAAGYCPGSSRNDVGEYGNYWGSTPYESDTRGAYSLFFGSGGHDVNWFYRDSGRTVRPVSE